MAGNTNPIWMNIPAAKWATLTTANTAKDGTGTVSTIYTAGANGDLFNEIRVKHLGTNVQTVLRIFLNNGATNATAINNILIGEMTIPAGTLIETASQPDYVWTYGKPIPPTYNINVTIGTAVAAGLAVSGHGGNF